MPVTTIALLPSLPCNYAVEVTSLSNDTYAYRRKTS